MFYNIDNVISTATNKKYQIHALLVNNGNSDIRTNNKYLVLVTNHNSIGNKNRSTCACKPNSCVSSVFYIMFPISILVPGHRSLTPVVLSGLVCSFLVV